MDVPTWFPSWQDNAAAVAEAIFETAEGPPPPERIAWLVDDLEHFLDTVGGRSRLVFHVALMTLATMGPPLVGRVGPLSRLDREARRRALERIERTPASMTVFAVKTLLCFHWYEHPDAARAAGLPTTSPRWRGQR